MTTDFMFVRSVSKFKLKPQSGASDL